MFLPRVRRLHRITRALCVALLIVCLPISTSAARPEKQRSLSDKLRQGPGLMNHPVHVRPSDQVRIPAGWPLEVDGTVTCLTCHTRLPSLSGGTATFLRGMDEDAADSTDLCTKCHDTGDRPTAASMHWIAVGRAHLTPEAARSGSGRGVLDAASRRCLGCHDGVTAGESINPIGRSGHAQSFGDRGRNHPIGVPYPGHNARNRSVPFRPASLLPQEVELPGGQVSCVSCHNMYSNRPALLTAPLDKSKLCLTCHAMD